MIDNKKHDNKTVVTDEQYDLSEEGSQKCNFLNCGIPNEETIKAIEEARLGEGIIKCKSIEDLFERLELKT